MKNNVLQIDKLLEKFYECETTLEEENALKKYFEGRIEAKHEQYAPQFRYYREETISNFELSEDFDNKILQAIKLSDIKEHNKLKRRKYVYSFVSMAASLMIIFGVYFLQKIEDEYSINEYNSAVSALMLISEKMEQASSELQNLEVLDNGFNELNALFLLENYGQQIINQ